jgi:hypothetical protein
MRHRLAGLVFCAASLFAQPRTPVVVELFTSEGCSSCPSADELLSRLDREFPEYEIITLGEHVDYWDELGWRDRYSSPLFSARQSEYGQLFRVESVYTPQMVINGQAQCLGSDLDAVRQAIKAVARAPQARLEIANRDHDTLDIRVGQFPQGVRETEILLAIVEDNIRSQVGAGENAGRRLLHNSVVRSMTRLATVDPKKNPGYSAEMKLNVGRNWDRRNLRIILLAQDRMSRRMVGAASVRLGLNDAPPRPINSGQ